MVRPIVFLSDFGLQDEFVGVCHGVMARLAPEAPVIDLSHGVPPGDVLRAALLLADNLPFMPDDTVYLAVVDPGVGSPRRAIAVEDPMGMAFVGPDNGLLSLAWVDEQGGFRAHEVTPDVVRSDTFHGRDVFAPAAARLASGDPVESLGPAVDPASLVRLERPRASFDGEVATSRILGVDHYGNVQLALTHDELQRLGVGLPRRPTNAARLVVTIGGRDHDLPLARTFGDVAAGEALAFVDSTGRVALAVNGGSAAGRFGVRPGDTVEVGPGVG
jgi:S-adenosylmethionine hydrolase